MPIIIIDNQEIRPLSISAYPTTVAGLPVGDYGIVGFSDWQNPQFIAERKSINDLVSSLSSSRKRFMRLIEKMRQFRFACLLIEGVEEDVKIEIRRREEISRQKKKPPRGKLTPQSIYASLDVISVRTGIHIFWCGGSAGAARKLEGLVRQFCRGIEKDYKRLGKVGVK